MNGGILILDKPEGLTSRDVDNAVMKTALTRKVGHLGTLDPFATGVLVVAIGQGTKFLPYLGGKRKTYIASLILGSKTDTGDKTGRVVEEKDHRLRAKERGHQRHQQVDDRYQRDEQRTWVVVLGHG